MFKGCSSLLSLPDISNWNVENVTSMNNMFESCSSLIDIPDLSKWEINKNVTFKNMFSKCFSLIKIPYFIENNNNIADKKQIFDDCISLVFNPNIKKVEI